MLGKNLISESNDLETTGIVYLEKILTKRERETTTEPEDFKEAKKQKKEKKELRIKFEGEEEGDVNEDTVKPENVLRMVDSSLVDTPEKQQLVNQSWDSNANNNVRSKDHTNFASEPPRFNNGDNRPSYEGEDQFQHQPQHQRQHQHQQQQQQQPMFGQSYL